MPAQRQQVFCRSCRDPIGKNHIDYLNTLYVYLRSFLNSKKTVEYFGFHRNTLLHRLRQIQAITDIHLDNEQELLNLLLALELRQSKER